MAVCCCFRIDVLNGRSYFSRLDVRRRQKQPSVVPEENARMNKPPLFGSFGDEAGYNGRSPSAAVLKAAFVVVMEGREHWYHRQQQLVDGRNLALDDSHKIVKGIRVLNEKVIHGVHTVISEHGQVVMQVNEVSDMFFCYNGLA